MRLWKEFWWYIMFLAALAAAIAFFVASLVRFVKTPKNDPKRKTRKVLLIVSSIILGIIGAYVIGISVIMMLVMLYM